MLSLFCFLVEVKPTYDTSHTKHLERERKSSCAIVAWYKETKQLIIFLTIPSSLQSTSGYDWGWSSLSGTDCFPASLIVYQHLLKGKERESATWLKSALYTWRVINDLSFTTASESWSRYHFNPSYMELTEATASVGNGFCRGKVIGLLLKWPITSAATKTSIKNVH